MIMMMMMMMIPMIMVMIFMGVQAREKVGVQASENRGVQASGRPDHRRCATSPNMFHIHTHCLYTGSKHIETAM